MECRIVTWSSLEETIRKHFEPGAPPISRRLESLHELHRNGIRTWLFIAPVLPHLTKRSLHELLDRIKDAVNYILVDTLNIKCGNWKGISTVLRADYPTLSSKWNDILFSHQKKEAYYEDVYGLIAEFCRAHALEVKCCWVRRDDNLDPPPPKKSVFTQNRFEIYPIQYYIMPTHINLTKVAFRMSSNRTVFPMMGRMTSGRFHSCKGKK